MNGDFSKTPREFHLFIDGEYAHPRDVFRVLYDGLETLIDSNRARLMAHRGPDPDQREKALLDFQDWTFADAPDVQARIKFDDGSWESYRIDARTEFDVEAIIKNPSVAFLCDLG